MKIVLKFGVLLCVVFISVKNVAAQGICVIPEQRISAIRGVVSFVDEKNEVGGANVRLRSIETKLLIAEVMTSENGSFEITGAYKGKYVLVVSRPSAVSLHIPIYIVKKRSRNYLHVTLGAFIEESCGGGEVRLTLNKEILRRYKRNK